MNLKLLRSNNISLRTHLQEHSLLKTLSLTTAKTLSALWTIRLGPAFALPGARDIHRQSAVK